jgi:flagellar hook protein FlgE
MLRSMYSGISGLRSHQTMMDVVGNNIANVNTTGYKSSATVFQDVLSQTIQGAGAPQNGLGGTNPAQVGLGVKVAGINTNFSQGASQTTGRATDLAIQGDGFFAVRQGQESVYTRSGSFNFDQSGTLVTSTGAVVQGWLAQDGVVNPNGALEDIRLPIGQTLPPEQTANVRFGGNLPAAQFDPAADPVVLTPGVTVYDAQGTPIKVSLQFTQTGDNTWDVVATAPATAGGADVELGRVPAPGLVWDPGTQSFNVDNLDLAEAQLDLAGTFNGGMTLALGTADEPMTQFSGQNSLAALEQDGSGIGTLQSFTISPDGTVVGVFSNGQNEPVGQIALANFANPGGLEKVGGSAYRPTVNSGLVQVGAAGAGGRGLLSGGTLEMSNVDLAQEFTNLIVAQRGFQANSRVISASDELLQDLVNLKR